MNPAEFLTEKWRRQARYWLVGMASQSDAEDVLADTICLFLEKCPADHPNPRAWFSLTLKRTCFAYNRKLSYRQHMPLIDAEVVRPAALGTEDEAFEVAEYVADLPSIEWVDRENDVEAFREAFARCKEDERKALLMLGEGFSYKEICAHMGWTYTKVNRCIAEGKARIRELVAV